MRMRVVKTDRAMLKLGCAIVIGLGGALASAAAEQGPDFNGDGFADLAIGVPNEPAATSCCGDGAVNVIYGSPLGLTTTGNQFWHQDAAGILGASEPGDFFGSAVAWGDFDDDGFADLAIGAWGEGLRGIDNVGAVNVIYGSPSGLTAVGNQFWLQDSPDILDGSEPTDYFGASLTSGDFNGDGFADLAIGARGETVGGANDAGAVNVIYGSPLGLTAAENQFWHQDSAGILDGSEPTDRFGASLTSGDFNADGFADLAIGADEEDHGGAQNAGAVNVIYGSPSGLAVVGNQFWHQNAPGILGGNEEGDLFGASLTSGDFNADGFADLAVGARGEEVSGAFAAGAAHVIYGSPSGLTAVGDQLWHQDSSGILGGSEQFDGFGNSLASGDFNNDGFADLAVGASEESLRIPLFAGAVNVIHGSPEGLTAVGNQIWHQDSPGILDVAEYSDLFGTALAVRDFDGNGFDDLAIGVFGESLPGVVGGGFPGAVNVIYGAPAVRGAPAGLRAAGNQFWHQNSAGILDSSESVDGFGAAL